jgi:hypothetical protein
VGCEQDRPISQGWPPDDGTVLLFPQSDERELDLLFVIDNSSSMAGEQASFRSVMPPLLPLRHLMGGLPDIHIGVISTDLGTGSPSGTGCDEAGDAGFLLTGNCTNPVGAPYIVDVAPRGCDVIREETSNACSDHNCGPAHCAHEPSTTFWVDSATGCPRCRNYAGESLDDVVSCITDLGTQGCDFEQPLESMYKALDPDRANNAGFLRETAVLAIVVITDEDDCSAKHDQIFDPNLDAPDGPLGPFTSFRCFEQGVTCDVDDRFATGLRHNCVPREDSASQLHPVSRYVDFLDSIKDRQMLSVAVLGGPVVPSAGGDGFDVEVGLDGNGNPMVQWSCTNPVDGAAPGIRLHRFAAAFNEPAVLDNLAYSSVCSGDLTPAMAGIGSVFREVFGYQCLPAPLRGCADPGVEYGTPRAPQTCDVNARCLPRCAVTDIFFRGLDTEQRHAVPPCLEVALDGTLLPGNTDRALAYATGVPRHRDPALPLNSCWFINYQEHCPTAQFAEILIARQADPPARTFTAVQCELLAFDEQICNDGRDNDKDCLVDMDDPCCQNTANCNS